MDFQKPLLEGRLINRYKRFLADIRLLDGNRMITAHCPNPGSMMGLDGPGNRVFVSTSDNPKRKLSYTWELVEVGGFLVGINTGMTNRLVEEAIRSGVVQELAGCHAIRREVCYGGSSRFDFFLENERNGCFVEVKSVTLMRGSLALFPDAVTERGSRHLRELVAAAAEGYRCVVCFVIQRADASRFVPASKIDPDFAAALRSACSHGVEVIAYGSEVNREGIRVLHKVPVSVS